jgi:hypothetical protein
VIAPPDLRIRLFRGQGPSTASSLPGCRHDAERLRPRAPDNTQKQWDCGRSAPADDDPARREYPDKYFLDISAADFYDRDNTARNML